MQTWEKATALGLWARTKAMPLYSLAAAQANDRAGPEGDFVMIAAGLMFFYAVGAIFGPLGAAALMQTFGPAALFAYTSSVHGVMAAMTVVQMLARAPVPRAARSRYVALLRTSPGFSRLADRDKSGPEG